MTDGDKSIQSFADAFSLVGALYLRGIQVEDLPYLRAIPELAAALPVQNEPPDQKTLDDWAAEHYRVFGMNVYPYASAFLDNTRMLGGRVSDEVLRFYAAGGFNPASQSEGPDHIGHELRFVAELIRMGKFPLLEEFCREHLFDWLLPLHHALHRQQSEFYSALAGVTISLLETCVEKIGGDSWANRISLATPPAGLLDNPETRLKDIAQYFLTPVYSGVYLSRENIAALGRRTRVPRGFGDRVQILSNLFHAGVDYEEIDSVFSLLNQEITGWIEAYAEWEQSAIFAPAAGYWKARAKVSNQIIEKLLEAVR